MTSPPDRPKVYHITHVGNLPSILASRGLWSDREMSEREGTAHVIGMSDIKRRRMEVLDVPCHPDTKVGDFVLFYFCPRSIMLFVIHRANHPDLAYRGGQEPIVHLEADLHRVVEYAAASGVPWCFSLSNAGAGYAEFRSGLDELQRLDWTAIAARDFKSPAVKEGKQAEFLLHRWFPFGLVERIGVRTEATRVRTRSALAGLQSAQRVEVLPQWHF